MWPLWLACTDSELTPDYAALAVPDAVRAQAGSVWTGTEWVVWGGDPTGYAGVEGHRYDPTTDTWTEMSIDGAPSPRMDPYVAWTGSEVLVWGGVPTSVTNIDFDQRGGLYDPETDTWRLTTAVEAPTQAGTSVWTDGELYHFAGATCVLGEAVVEEAKAYDPAANTWRDLDPEGVPAKEGSAPIVFTGTEILLAGGRGYGCDSGGLFTDDSRGGALYDLEDESWTPISESRAPETTDNAIWAWADDSFLVHSRAREGGLVGGAYDPAEDRWRPTPARKGPRAKGGFATRGVWTGAQFATVYGRRHDADNSAEELALWAYDAETERWGNADLPLIYAQIAALEAIDGDVYLLTTEPEAVRISLR